MYRYNAISVPKIKHRYVPVPTAREYLFVWPILATLNTVFMFLIISPIEVTIQI